MSTIHQREADTYAELWSAVPNYRKQSPGEDHAQVFHEIVNDPGTSVLDAGCGEGRAMVSLAALGYHVAGMDIAEIEMLPAAQGFPRVIDTLWSDLRPVVYVLHAVNRQVFEPDHVDYVFCCDVLEHLPVQFTMLAIDQMLRIAKKGVFLSIYFQPDDFGAWVGRPLHQTVQPFVWWREALKEIAEIVEARDCLKFGIFYVKPL